ncbi:alkaline phosphatase family protein [Legionella sp. CNM-4043-24]|uniref:alkaline phosphatase family protein n=1 Tax=Legionella sp. CNM-4043-24 TaxID=3421646 RepID=UPI00403B1238
MKRIIPLIFLLGSQASGAQPDAPRLIVQLVVDQLRGDLLHQYQNDFGPNGFNYLLSHGINFQNAHHPHAYTITCVGHTTISTGAYPSLHGIIGNEWFDRDSGEDMYCVGDNKSAILPTARSKKTLEGRSPRNILSSTLSDEVVLSKTGRSFAVSLKDRAAISLAGHAGKAFWFDRENGGFVTSQYYYASYPSWVSDWNAQYKDPVEAWTLSKEPVKYRFADTPVITNDYPDFGKTFPHQTGAPGNSLYYKHLSMTPKTDEFSADFASRLIREEKLGQTAGKTDYLGISFSSVDAIGHQFGPNSLESEENLLRLDKTLASLLSNIDKEVGLENTLIVLTADHGIADSPAYLAQNHMNNVAPVDEKALRQLIETRLAERHKLPAKALQAIRLPYLYLDHRVLAEAQVSLQAVSNTLVEMLNQQEGIFRAYPLPISGIEQDWLSAKVDKMAIPNRAGDIYLVQPPYQSAGNDSVRVDHGTPWRYDSFVPLLFVNPAFKPQRVSEPVYTNDIAPTLAAILQIKAPSAAVSRPLPAVMAYYETHESDKI